MSVVLQIDTGKQNFRYPFKFNHSWFEECDLKEIIRNKWTSFISVGEVSKMDIIVQN